MADISADNPFARFATTDTPGTVVSGDENPFAKFAPPAADPNATPDAPTWLGRRAQDIEGKQDPRFKDVPTVYSQNRDTLEGPMGAAATLGASDAQMLDVVKKHLGDSYIGAFNDANGYPIVRFKDQSGNEQQGYLNKPGLDSEDVARGVRGALPYAAMGELLGPALAGYPRIARALGIGTGGATISATGDEALKPLGSEQGIDLPKAGTMLALGPAGEAVGAAGSALWNRFVQIPRYFDKASGQLTPLGRQAAQSMGLDPDQMAADAMQTFGKTYAMDPAAAQQSVDAGNFDFNIPVTKGQLSKDPQQLLQEKAMRSGLYGLDAKNQIEDLDKRQTSAIGTALTDTIPQRITGFRGGGASPEVYGNVIGRNLDAAQANAKDLERAAWRDTGALTPKTIATTAPDAMTPMTGVEKTTSTMAGGDLLSDTLRQNLEPLASVISPENTPTTFKMWSYLNDFMAGKKPSSALHASLGLSGSRDLDSVRRAIGLMSKDASTATDQAGASAIYKGFNQWIDQAADQSFLSGDSVLAAKLRTARDVSREMNGIFQPKQNGQLTPGAKILQRIAANADTPERIVSSLIPTPNAEIPAGTIEALNLIRRGTQKYPDPNYPSAGAQVWNSIKLAYLSKLTQNKSGAFLSPQVMSTNLRKAMNNQATLYNTIFAPSDRAVINRFVTQLDRVAYRDPNPSGTATSLAGLGKQLFGKLLDAFGPLGRAAWDYTGLQHAWGSSIARQAVKQAAPVFPRSAPNAMLNYLPAAAAPGVILNDDQPPPMNALARRLPGNALANY